MPLSDFSRGFRYLIASIFIVLLIWPFVPDILGISLVGLPLLFIIVLTPVIFTINAVIIFVKLALARKLSIVKALMVVCVIALEIFLILNPNQ